MKLTDLRGILQYIPRFREKTFILSIDGAIITDENFANILLDVAVLRSLNIRVVLVHGASAQIHALAEEQKVFASDLDGAGITESSSFAEDLDADSLALIELVEALEEELGERVAGFRIADEDLEDLRTVRDAVDYVSAKVVRS